MNLSQYTIESGHTTSTPVYIVTALVLKMCKTLYVYIYSFSRCFKMHNAKCKVLIRLEATAKTLMMDK